MYFTKENRAWEFANGKFLKDLAYATYVSSEVTVTMVKSFGPWQKNLKSIEKNINKLFGNLVTVEWIEEKKL